MSRAVMVQLHFFAPGLNTCQAYCLRSNDRIPIYVALRGNARVRSCLHEQNVQVVPVAMWCRWTRFCLLLISTSSVAMIASCFGKFQKLKTAPQVQF